MDSRKYVTLRFMENKKRKRKLGEETYDDDKLFFSNFAADEADIIPQITQAVVETITSKKPRKDKIKNRDRTELKNFWSHGYANWSDDEFKERLRIGRESFEFILDRIQHLIEKTPTKMVPNPIESHRQLALTIYRIAHGCSFKVLKDLFGVSQSLATETFNQVMRVMIVTLYEEFVHLPASEDEWTNECKNFSRKL